MREPIKNYQGRIIGFIEVKSNGDKVLYDFPGKILGKYNKSLNVTQDFYGRQVGKGDILMTLLR
ncbi:MAG: hypothetical protein IJN42_00365 [Clostridia bacterium]|nr:hypothetical protein [Clostridia bacterium]